MDIPEEVLEIHSCREAGSPESGERGLLQVSKRGWRSLEPKLALESNVPFVMQPKPVSMLQHSEEEWDSLRAIIIGLYINQKLPLRSVMRKIETEHHFRASERMYKTRLRKWNSWKNRHNALGSRKGTNGQATQSQAAELPSNPSPRYLCQNDCDEEMHTILDQVTPYFQESFRSGIWRVGSDYLYDEFTQHIAQSMSCFLHGNPTRGGYILRQAFLSLEALILGGRIWTLERMMYAVSGLVASGYYDISKVLLFHSSRLAAAKFERFHPMVQVLSRFAIICQKDPAYLAYAMLTVWRLCHSVTNTDKTNSILLYLSRKQFWQDPQNWPTQQPTIRNLQLFLQKVESEFGEYHDISIVIHDELLAIYAQIRHEEYEQTALEMTRRIDWRLARDASSPELVSWKRNANYGLACFYWTSGEHTRAIEHLQQVISDCPCNEWELEQFEMLQGWQAEAAVVGV